MKRRALVCGSSVLALSVAMFLTGCEDEHSDSDGDVSRFQGTLAGTWVGSGASGGFSVTIAPDGTVSGTFWGGEGGILSGTVDGDGRFSAYAETVFEIVTWSGWLNTRNGHVDSGNGTWSASRSGANGTWAGS